MDALWCLEMCGATDWLSADMEKEIARLTGRGGDESDRAAIILGAMGAHGAPYAQTLKEASDKEKAEFGPAPIGPLEAITQVALARMRGQWSAESARPALKAIGGAEDLEVATLFALDAICNRMLEEKDLKVVFALIEDTDPKTVIGAARFCFALGARARVAAEPSLIKVLQTHKDKAVRLEVIRALGMVGNLETVARLQEVASRGVPEEEKQAIAESIALIRAVVEAFSAD